MAIITTKKCMKKSDIFFCLIKYKLSFTNLRFIIKYINYEDFKQGWLFKKYFKGAVNICNAKTNAVPQHLWAIL